MIIGGVAPPRNRPGELPHKADHIGPSSPSVSNLYIAGAGGEYQARSEAEQQEAGHKIQRGDEETLSREKQPFLFI